MSCAPVQLDGATEREALSFTIVLPCYYSSATLGACLDALDKQTRRPHQVIVVNSSPDEETAAVAARFPWATLIESSERLLPHAARNLGVLQAVGDVLVFSDPDCVAQPDWLDSLAQAFSSRGELETTIVGGAMGLFSTGWRAAGIHLCKFHRLLPGGTGVHPTILPTANVAFSRAAWDAVGPFDGDRFAGDASICWRAAAAGIELSFDPRAVVRHQHTESLGSFCRQRLERGQEFIVARATHEQWSKSKRAAYVLAQPLLVPWIAAKGLGDAVRAGWAAPAVKTFPVQLAGHIAWNLGETWGLLRPLFAGKRTG